MAAIAAAAPSPPASAIDHAVAQGANLWRRDLDHIPRLQIDRRIEPSAGAGRRTGRDDIAGLEGRERRNVGDEVGEAEDEARRRVILAELAVDPRLHRDAVEPIELVCCNHPRPYRAAR